MKRLNKLWWKDDKGYYKQTQKGVYEGPYESIDTDISYSDDKDNSVVEMEPSVIYPRGTHSQDT